jgi:carboxyl-terminal processing protease
MLLLGVAPAYALETPTVSEDTKPEENLFPFPSGARATLSCEELHRAVATFDAHLAFDPPAADPAKIAAATADWLDPYALWAPVDGAVERALDEDRKALLREISAKAGDCHASERLGVVLDAANTAAKTRLLGLSQRGSAAPPMALGEAAAMAITPTTENADQAEDARFRAAVATMTATLGKRGERYRQTLEAHLFPAATPSTAAGLLRASLLRGWVPLVDGHGNWAPTSESTSIYDTDLTDDVTPRLFERATATLGGARLDSGARAPLVDGDVLVAVEPGTVAPSPAIFLAGLSPESLDEVAVAAFADRAVVAVPALWIHEGKLVRGVIPRPKPGPDGKDAPYTLPHRDLPWGDQRLLLVTVHDVHDEFGKDLRALIREERLKSPALAGIILDLRGNGGGSMDGAIEALAAFLPDVPLFPLESRHEEAVTVDRTETPPAAEQWAGPVAALVDHDTASAAEMLAGALDAYRRGPVIGTTTFGKGCVQSFEDDGARPPNSVGAFRLTTYLYALPDGRPVQRRGLVPTIPFPFVVDGAIETEADTPAAPPSFTGPDVREKTAIGHAVPFPAPGASFLETCLAALPDAGASKVDDATCKALALLAPRPPKKR